MKRSLIILFSISVLLVSCTNNNESTQTNKKNQSPATYTGVKKYYDKGKLVKETSLKDGMKDGICKNYYDDGRLKRTIWYKNGVKEDTAKWFYRTGEVYRATPYKNDKIHGLQMKYYKTGYKQAILPYKNGLRTQGLKEFFPDGRELTTSIQINHEIKDEYNTNDPIVKVFTRLSNESVNVRFYKGSLIDGAFDPEKCKDITSSSGMGFVELMKDTDRGKSYVDIIAVYSSRFKNKMILIKRIKLPYNDLI